MKLVIVDIDGTLVTASTERRFALHLLRRGWLGPRQWRDFLLFTLQWWPRFGVHTFKKNKAYLGGLDCDTVTELAARFVATETPRRLFVPCVERIQQHLAAGDKVVLLSGTPQFIAAPLGELLGVGHAVGTVCAIRDGYFSTAPPVRHPFGVTKLELAREIGKRYGQSLASATAYADSHCDLELLRAVGTAVAVRPDARLAAVARAHRWEIIEDPHQHHPLRRFIARKDAELPGG